MADTMADSVPLLRIFISSPGDVREERDLARALIKDELAYLPAFRGRVTFEAVSWDDPAARVAMLANETPQESVNRSLPRPATCDLVLLILWSRMGTPLPEVVRKPNGDGYVSGTEWEYLDAKTSPFKPPILIYHRTEEPKVGLRDPLRAEKVEQFERVGKFLEQFRNPDGSLAGGVNEYAVPADFRALLRQHLEEMVWRRLGPSHWGGTAEAVPGEIAVAHIEDFVGNKERIRAALALYEERIPPDERYDLEQMVDLVRRHLSDEFGPAWKMHFLIATFEEAIAGMLICYEDVASNFAFISYLAARKTASRGKKPRDVSEHLGSGLAEVRRKLGLPGARFIFEVDHPALAPDRKERARRLGRIRLFNELAPYESLHLRALDIRYLQPILQWPGTGRPKELMLCYAAAGLQNSLPKADVAEILRWTYTALYGDDIFEDPSTRAEYRKHTWELLDAIIGNLPERVALLRYEEIAAR